MRGFNKDEISFHSLFGHIMRYCAECADIWLNFKSSCEAEGARVQRVLDLWEIEKRAELPLKLTPLDLPRLMVEKNGQGIVLG
jgi:hypothetical protein